MKDLNVRAAAYRSEFNQILASAGENLREAVCTWLNTMRNQDMSFVQLRKWAQRVLGEHMAVGRDLFADDPKYVRSALNRIAAATALLLAIDEYERGDCVCDEDRSEASWGAPP